jgi:hypothetical protein
LPRQVEVVLWHNNQEQFRLWFPAVEVMP